MQLFYLSITDKQGIQFEKQAEGANRSQNSKADHHKSPL